MTPLDQSDIDLLLGTALFRHMRRRDRARLLIHLQRVELAQGDLLFDSRSEPDTLYIIGSGRLEFESDDGEAHVLSHGILGQEPLLGGDGYIGRVKALEPSLLYGVPSRQLEPVVAELPGVRSVLFDALMSRMSGHAAGIAGRSEPAGPTGSAMEGGNLKLLGWGLAMVAPLAVWHFASALGFADNATYFLAIIACTMVMWLFNLVPAFVAPMFSVLLFILFDVAPPQVAMAGFASSGFFMLLSIFAVGALMVMSGLTYRISLNLLRLFPGSPFWYGMSLFLPGVLLTPILPSQLGRTVIVTPSIADLIEASGAGRNDRMAAQFVASGVVGLSLMASIFLTGKPANLIVFGMFDAQTQFAFEWTQWLWAASCTGLLLLALYFLCLPFFFRSERAFRLPRHVIHNQLRALGPLTGSEWATLAAITLLIAGILAAPLLKVGIPWLALTILMALLFFGAIKREDISRRIDWSILIFIGSIIAWVPVMKLTGIEEVIARELGWVGTYMQSDLKQFILALCGFIVLIRFALPELVAEILLVTILFPLAGTAGISIWLIGFVILTMCESYIFPYQAPYHIQMKNLLSSFGQEGRYDETRVILFNLMMTITRVVAIYASIPFWKYLDIL